MKYLFCLLTILTGFKVTAQNSVTVSGETYAFKGKTYSVTVLAGTKKAVGDEFVYLAHIPVNEQLKFNYKLSITKPRWLVIRYIGNVNRVYVYPGDSLHITFKELSKADTLHSMVMTFATIEEAHYSGSDTGRMAFFETLIKKTGIIDSPPFKMDAEAPGFLMAYKERVTALYNQRMRVLDTAAGKYHFRPDFKAVAANEIRGAYMNDLMCVAFFHNLWDKYPPGYFDEVSNEAITWDKVKDSKGFSSILYMYVMYYNRRIAGQTDEQKLASAFENCTRLKDDSVRNFMMTVILSKNMESHPANFDDLFQQYQQLCTNPEYVNGLTALYQPPVLNRLLPVAVLNASLKNNKDAMLILKDILPANKPVLIDFWASWCGPCMKEIPELQKLAEKYKGKIDFRYISVDTKEKEPAWLKAVKDKNLDGDQYIIQDKTIVDFAVLKSIPRYFVIDKDGKLTTFRGPSLLTNASGFEDQIKAVVK